MPAHQTRFYARDARTLRQQIQRRNKAFDTFLVSDFADIQQTRNAIVSHALVGGRKLLRVISRSNDEHFCGFDIKDFDDFALLLLMQGENHIERADGIHDAFALKAMVAHLTQIGRMTHRSHRNAWQRFASNGAREIQVMAYNHVSREFRGRMPDALGKCRAKLFSHGRCKVAIARGGIRHHIGHAAHIERQRLGVEAHEIRLGALRQRWFIGRIDAGDHGGCMAGRKFATHHFRQIHAASRRIGLLRRDIQNAHTRHLSFEFESSYRGAKGSCASRPRIAQASPRKAESPKVRKDLSARKRHARYD